ncbi:MAG: hypothetical protein DRG50_00590 [Deltaproteobacteria bacterium]|nr:MAG: hypothetical protein DRG50_00590 [Deltaproteobacteria bacterium]
MAKIPDIAVLEPAAEQSRRRAAGVFVGKEVQPDLESLKARLREIRQHCRDNQGALQRQLEKTMGQFPEVKLTFAADVKEAAAYIKEVAGKAELASINKSSVVINELRPQLQASGLKTYIRYFKEFNDFEKRIEDYWDLPGLHERGLVESFDVSQTLSHLRSLQVRDYIAILGVNAVSAEDGSVFFLQHMANISKDLEQAKKIILVIGLEKVVKDREAALFQTRCMGIFGLESILLDLGPKDVERYDFDALAVLPRGQDRELHVLILDNGRSELLEDGYRDLFLCIDCRACARQCPIGMHLDIKEWVWSPKNYLFGFLQGWIPSTEASLHCGRCKMECPVDIDIPSLIWKAQFEHYARYGRSWRKRLLDNPEVLAKVGSWTAPLSNWAKGIPPFKVAMELVAGIHRKANLPSFNRQTLRNWFRGNRG